MEHYDHPYPAGTHIRQYVNKYMPVSSGRPDAMAFAYAFAFAFSDFMDLIFGRRLTLCVGGFQ